MKLKTSYFNVTAFKKNLTRFAPAWGLYIVCLLMGLFLMMDSGTDYWMHANIADCIQIMPIVNLGYALICAQLLFGDLYNSRMCNMLHALPIRREGWFVTHIVSGLTFSFVPTLVMTAAALALSPFSSMVNGWQIPLFWWLGSNLEFLFFFGVAVLSALCVGSRFAQAVVYGIINFAAVLAYWLVDSLYTPMYYGLKTNEEPFLWFSPLVRMTEKQYIDTEHVETFLGLNAMGQKRVSYHGEFTVTGHWWYLVLCAVVGIGFMVLALQLYRKRRLETAGDFIAVRVLEPVFLVVYTLVVGTCFHVIISEMFGYGQGLVFLIAGLLIGFFTGRMFLERNVKVFHRKNWLRCGALMAAFLLSLGISYADPFGIEDWVPEADEVQAVGIASGWGTYHQSEITLTDPEDIAKVIAIHKAELEEYQAGDNETRIITTPTAEVTVEIADSQMYKTDEVEYYNADITFTYDLKNGSSVSRYYLIWTDTEAGQTIEDYFSSVLCNFGMEEPDFTNWPKSGYNYNYGGVSDEVNEFISQTDDMHGLLEAIVADCDAGTMCQDYSWRRGSYEILWMEWGGHEFNIRNDNEHCMQWFRDQGLDIDTILDEYYDKGYYG